MHRLKEVVERTRLQAVATPDCASWAIKARNAITLSDRVQGTLNTSRCLPPAI